MLVFTKNEENSQTNAKDHTWKCVQCKSCANRQTLSRYSCSVIHWQCMYLILLESWNKSFLSSRDFAHRFKTSGKKDPWYGLARKWMPDCHGCLARSAVFWFSPSTKSCETYTDIKKITLFPDSSCINYVDFQFIQFGRTLWVSVDLRHVCIAQRSLLSSNEWVDH